MFTSTVFYLLNLTTWEYEPVSAADLTAAVVVLEDGQIAFALEPGQDLRPVADSDPYGPWFSTEVGELYFYEYSEALGYQPIPTSDLYDAIGEGRMDFETCEGCTVMVSSTDDAEGLYLTLQQY